MWLCHSESVTVPLPPFLEKGACHTPAMAPGACVMLMVVVSLQIASQFTCGGGGEFTATRARRRRCCRSPQARQAAKKASMSALGGGRAAMQQKRALISSRPGGCKHRTLERRVCSAALHTWHRTPAERHAPLERSHLRFA